MAGTSMIARTEKRRAQQDEDPHRRENSESNTEYGHLLTPNSEFLLPRGYHSMRSEKYAASLCGYRQDKF
jgi:hypothetical protein